MKADLSLRLVDQTSDAIIAIGLDGKVLEWNRGGEIIFGFQANEAIGRRLIDLIVPSDRVEEEMNIQREAIERPLAVYESVRRRKDGSLVHLSVSTLAIRDEKGKVKYLISTKKDVTHLKIMRDSKLLEAKFRDLLESTPDAIVMVNVTGRVVLINSQAEKLFGYDKAQLIGQPIEILLPERFRGGHVGHRANFFGQPRTRSMGAGLELYGLHRKGTSFRSKLA